MKERDEIIKWASEKRASDNLSAHNVLDDMNDRLKIIKMFYSDECSKDQCGLVLPVEEAELLAYEYARRLETKKIIELSKGNWFEKLPLHWKLTYYLIGGIAIGLLLPYCF